jgi:hypothetical protein
MNGMGADEGSGRGTKKQSTHRCVVLTAWVSADSPSHRRESASICGCLCVAPAENLSKWKLRAGAHTRVSLAARRPVHLNRRMNANPTSTYPCGRIHRPNQIHADGRGAAWDIKLG